MPVYQDITTLPAFKNPVITIGTFDGVHQGHLQIIKQLKSEADAVDGTPIVITFYPHPKQVVQNTGKPVYILNTLEEKYRLLNSHGINDIVVIPFNKTFAEQPAINYIRDFLVNKFHPHTIIIGYDHRFGMNREGDYKLLEKEAEKYNYRVKEIPEHVLHDITISSTKIREALLNGNISIANEFLGYRYSFSGKVVEGKRLGRQLGYPTANIELEYADKLVPAIGIYAVEVRTVSFKQPLKGMMSIGTNPTVNGTARTIEVNIFDFQDDIYGETLDISFVKWLRAEEKYDSLEALKDQLAKDKIAALAAF